MASGVVVRPLDVDTVGQQFSALGDLLLNVLFRSLIGALQNCLLDELFEIFTVKLLDGV